MSVVSYMTCNTTLRNVTRQQRSGVQGSHCCVISRLHRRGSSAPPPSPSSTPAATSAGPSNVILNSLPPSPYHDPLPVPNASLGTNSS